MSGFSLGTLLMSSLIPGFFSHFFGMTSYLIVSFMPVAAKTNLFFPLAEEYYYYYYYPAGVLLLDRVRSHGQQIE